ncbi:MAG: hypothetical protein LBN18_01260 [Dysgonamonadaceae bacterium]|nr:hypothetical protein [Dysgonamonadaceae bacterium]
MKSYLVRILLFISPLLLLLIGTEIYLRQRPSNFKDKKEQFLEKTGSIEILITGSSHAQNGLIADQFTLPAYNLAFGSQSLYFDKRITEQYLPQMPRLKYVLIALEYMSLYSEHDENRDFFYHAYYGIDFPGRSFWKESLSQTFFVYDPRETVHLIVDDWKPAGKSVDPWTAPDHFDYEKEVLSPEKNRTRAEVFQRVIEAWQGDDRVLKDLESFIADLQAHNVTPILINFPCPPTLRSLHDPKILAANQQAIDYLTTKYNILYLDYWDDDSFTTFDYFDPDHLNVHGAEKLSLKVNKAIMDCFGLCPRNDEYEATSLRAVYGEAIQKIQ